MKPSYTYRAHVMRVYDADTIFVDIDLGCGVHLCGVNGRGEPLRLLGIDAWEVRGEEREKGLLAKAFVEKICYVGRLLIIETTLDKKGKYGRLLAKVNYCEHGLDGENWRVLSDDLVENGHARYVHY